MNPGMVPAALDVGTILDDLNAAGLTDNRVEAACDFSIGYVSQLRSGKIKRFSYEFGARLYNLWIDTKSATASESTQ